MCEALVFLLLLKKLPLFLCLHLCSLHFTLRKALLTAPMQPLMENKQNISEVGSISLEEFRSSLYLKAERSLCNLIELGHYTQKSTLTKPNLPNASAGATKESSWVCDTKNIHNLKRKQHRLKTLFFWVRKSPCLGIYLAELRIKSDWRSGNSVFANAFKRETHSRGIQWWQ